MAVVIICGTQVREDGIRDEGLSGGLGQLGAAAIRPYYQATRVGFNKKYSCRQRQAKGGLVSIKKKTYNCRRKLLPPAAKEVVVSKDCDRQMAEASLLCGDGQRPA